MAGTYDYGPLGAVLKRSIVGEWLRFFVDGWDDMYQVDTAILMNPKVWQASGHVDTFTDPIVECSNCHARFRADHLLRDGHIKFLRLGFGPHSVNILGRVNDSEKLAKRTAPLVLSMLQNYIRL